MKIFRIIQLLMVTLNKTHISVEEISPKEMEMNVFHRVVLIFFLLFILSVQCWHFRQLVEKLNDSDCDKFKSVGCKCIAKSKVECSANMSQLEINVFETVSGTEISINCNLTYAERDIYYKLPKMNLTGITSAYIRHCPLASFSFNTSIFKHFGIQQIRSLSYRHPLCENSDAATGYNKIKTKSIYSVNN